MNSKKLMEIIVVFSIVAMVNGNLITLDGQCPFADMKPLSIDAAEILRGAPLTMNTIAETAPINGINRTDITEIFEFKEPNEVKVTLLVRSKETGQCDIFYLFMKPSNEPGIYDALYQGAPNTSFGKYKAAFLSFDPITMKSVGMACRNLSNSQYQIEVVVMSAFTTEYDETTQEEVIQLLESNNLGYLSQYVGKIAQNTKCY